MASGARSGLIDPRSPGQMDPTTTSTTTIISHPHIHTHMRGKDVAGVAPGRCIQHRIALQPNSCLTHRPRSTPKPPPLLLLPPHTPSSTPSTSNYEKPTSPHFHPFPISLPCTKSTIEEKSVSSERQH